MCGLFGSDSPPEPPRLPPPPKPEEIMDYIDEVTGTQTITVTGADGKKRRVTQKLPRTEAEQRFVRQGEELIGRALRNINELYQYRPQDVVDFTPIINTFANINNERMNDLAQIANFGNIQQEVDNFRQIQRNLMDEEYNRLNRTSETDLARRGLQNSTVGEERRALMARNQSLARQEGELKAQTFGEDLASRRLSRNAGAFALREEGRQGELLGAKTAYELAQQRQLDLERRRQQAIQENMGAFQVGSGLRGEDLAKSMGGRTGEMALAQFNAVNADSMNRYNADIGRQNMNYQNELAAYNARPQSFGDKMLTLGGTVAGGMLSAPSSSLLGRAGTATFGRFF